jgi:hypothetical protein
MSAILGLPFLSRPASPDADGRASLSPDEMLAAAGAIFGIKFERQFKRCDESNMNAPPFRRARSCEKCRIIAKKPRIVAPVTKC